MVTEFIYISLYPKKNSNVQSCTRLSIYIILGCFYALELCLIFPCSGSGFNFSNLNISSSVLLKRTPKCFDNHCLCLLSYRIGTFFGQQKHTLKKGKKE